MPVTQVSLMCIRLALFDELYDDTYKWQIFLLGGPGRIGQGTTKIID